MLNYNSFSIRPIGKNDKDSIWKQLPKYVKDNYEVVIGQSKNRQGLVILSSNPLIFNAKIDNLDVNYRYLVDIRQRLRSHDINRINENLHKSIVAFGYQDADSIREFKKVKLLSSKRRKSEIMLEGLFMNLGEIAEILGNYGRC